jgi:hypothetical protein
MAAKLPIAMGGDALAGPHTHQLPYISTAGSAQVCDAVAAGTMRGPDLVLPFVPASSATDLDNGDTITLIPTSRKIIRLAWCPASLTALVPTVNTTTNVIAVAATANSAGWLLVWLDTL